MNNNESELTAQIGGLFMLIGFLAVLGGLLLGVYVALLLILDLKSAHREGRLGKPVLLFIACLPLVLGLLTIIENVGKNLF